jgi:hypothetical protein
MSSSKVFPVAVRTVSTQEGLTSLNLPIRQRAQGESKIAQPPPFQGPGSRYYAQSKNKREAGMERIVLIGVILLSAVASTATLAASQEQCSAEWKKADRDLDGDLSGNEITTYLIGIMKDPRHRDAGKDGKITLDEFMAACKDGAFDEVINKAK